MSSFAASGKTFFARPLGRLALLAALGSALLALPAAAQTAPTAPSASAAPAAAQSAPAAPAAPTAPSAQSAAAAPTAPAAPAAAATPRSLSLEEALAAALAQDPGLRGAELDWRAANARADSARWRQLPSLSASAGYQRLSDLTSSLSLPGAPQPISFGSLDNIYSFGLNLQYPLFAGFKLQENIAIAALQAQVKEVARDTAKRSLVFELRRAYWEALRATHNVSTLAENLALMRENSALASRQLGEGVLTRADELGAQMRLEQATEDLADAQAQRRRSYLALASMMGLDPSRLGMTSSDLDAPPPFLLTTSPESPDLVQPAPLPDEASLVAEALARRPETRTASLARALAEHQAALARSALYPTLALTGNYTYADPNQRVAFQSDPGLFTGTWALGLQLTYDLGALPAALDDTKSQSLAAAKAKADEERQRASVVMDVETCLVNLQRARRDFVATQAMVAQAQENLRVMQGRVAAGTAKDIDLASAKFDLLRTDFAVTNRRIDLLIAQADLARAAASEDLP